MATHTDTALLSLVKENDESAFTELYNRYWELIYAKAYAILRNRSQAQDIVQEVFLSLWRRRQEVEILEIGAYLKQAAKFQVYKILREEKASKSLNERLAVITVDILNENPLLFKEQQDIVNRLLAALPEEYRLAFNMSRFENKTYKEIAICLNVSEKTIEYRISKSLKLLREDLSLSSVAAAILLQSFF